MTKNTDISMIRFDLKTILSIASFMVIIISFGISQTVRISQLEIKVETQTTAFIELKEEQKELRQELMKLIQLNYESGSTSTRNH